MTVFELKILCEDNKLAKLLWSLDGVIVGEPMIRPIRGAAKVGNQVQATLPEGNLIERVMHLIRAHSHTSLTPEDIKDLVVKGGGKALSSHYVIKSLRDAGFLGKKEKGKMGAYPVIGPATAIAATNGPQPFRGKILNEVVRYLGKREDPNVTRADLMFALKTAGGSPKTLNTLVDRLKKVRMLSRSPNRGGYVFNRGATT
jgi:hypothetical protein